MMFESNYDNRLAAPGNGAKVGAANGKQIILKHDSKLKQIGKRKRRSKQNTDNRSTQTEIIAY